MRHGQLASILNVPSIVLSRKSGKARGSFLVWICREILINASSILSEEDKNVLIDMLRLCMCDQAIIGGVLSTAFNNRILTFESPIINRLIRDYSYKNPHNVII